MSDYSFTPDYLTRDGSPWFPVMGEIHYSRYPRQYWKEALLRMKAGGVDIVSAYVIWIHHEEIEGQYDFTGDRDLHGFAEAVKECGLKFILRIGPWSHAEVRNGGFPDWLLNKPFEARTNDERYFAVVETWYKTIFSQVKDMLWSPDSTANPIIGVQIENEYGHCGGLQGEAGEEHMRRLTAIARETGFDVPLYTATGWGGAVTGGLLPVMGGYCDAPWDQRITEIEPSGNFVFTHERNDHNIGSDYGFGAGITFDLTRFPYLTAELGGGLQMTDHRRTVAQSADIGAMSLVKLGSGVNLLGYYMYHGGTNPEGKLTTLQESRATGYLNDLPEKSYDFRAPIREYGQISDTFRELKLLTYFVHDFNTEICTTKAFIPDDNPLKPADTEHLRYSFRSDGYRGWLFVNNHVRHQKMESHHSIDVRVPSDLCGHTGNTFSNLTVRDGDYFFLPFNMKCGSSTIATANVTPFCRIRSSATDSAAETTVFYARKNMSLYSNLITYTEGSPVEKNILVLSHEDALNAWKTADGCLIITEGSVIEYEYGKKTISGRAPLRFAVYPPLENTPEGFEYKGMVEKNLYSEGNSYKFAVYQQMIRSEEEAAHQFEEEADWKVSNNCIIINISNFITILADKKKYPDISDCFLTVRYLGNKARLYAWEDGKRVLIADNFFSGTEYPWEIGLKRFLTRNIDFSRLELEVDPLQKDDRVYLETMPDFSNGPLCQVTSIRTAFEQEVILDEQPLF